MRSNIKTIILYAVLIIGIIIVASSVLRNINADTKLEYSEIIDLFYEDKVEKFEINSRNILTVKTIPEKTEDGQIIEGKTYTRTLRSLELFLYDIKDYLDGHREGKIQNLQTYDSGTGKNIMALIIPAVYNSHRRNDSFLDIHHEQIRKRNG